MLIDLNDSIFRDSPQKTDVATDRASTKELEMVTRCGLAVDAQASCEAQAADLHQRVTVLGREA